MNRVGGLSFRSKQDLLQRHKKSIKKNIYIYEAQLPGKQKYKSSVLYTLEKMHLTFRIQTFSRIKFVSKFNDSQNALDHVNFVYNKCDFVHSSSFLAGTILHRS